MRKLTRQSSTARPSRKAKVVVELGTDQLAQVSGGADAKSDAELNAIRNMRS